MNITGVGFLNWDIAVVVIYLAGSLCLGVWGSRLMGMKSGREEDYFLAGRRMPGWLNGISWAATALNSDVAPLYCGVAAAVGLSGCWFFLSRFGMAMMAAALLFAVRWRQMNIRTGPEFLALRYGKGQKFARVYTSLNSVLFGMIPWIGAGLIGIHMIAAPVFGYESRWITILAIVPVLSVYVWSSGFAGVLITDAIQSIVILGGNILLFAVVLVHFGGPSGLAEAVASSCGENAENLLSLLPNADNAVLPPATLLAWTLLASVGAGSGVAADGQRLFSCKNNREAAKMGIYAEAVLFAMLLMLMLPVMGILARHPELYTADPSRRENAYGMMLAEFLPPGCIGLTVAALMAAVMSTMSTHLNYGSQTLLNDVYRPLAGEPPPGKEVWIGRLMMLGIALLSILVVFASDSLLGIAITVIGIFGSSATFGWGQWWFYRVNFKGWCAAIVAGPVVYFICGFLLPLIPWWAERMAQSGAMRQNMQLLQALIAMAVNTAIWMTVVLCTKPEKMEILKEFYLRARPMGFWRPVREELIREGRLPDVPQPTLLPFGFLAAAMGFTMIVFAVLTISAFYVFRWRAGTCCAAGAVLSGIVFKYMFDRWIRKMEEAK